MNDPYPYETDPESHPFAWVFFYIAGIATTLDVANAMAKHVFDDLGCAPPGTEHEPNIKYDALGGSGAPWEPGMWIPVEDDRMQVIATAPDKDITAMSQAERAELRAALDAADDADRAGATNKEGA